MENNTNILCKIKVSNRFRCCLVRFGDPLQLHCCVYIVFLCKYDVVTAFIILHDKKLKCNPCLDPSLISVPGFSS